MFWRKKDLNIGELGEKIAGKYLKGKGYKIIEYNYQNKTGRRVGEIDIVTQLGEQIVFVEVKSRIVKEGSLVLPEENITRDKLQKLQRIAKEYIREKYFWDKSYRFDAVAVLFSENRKNVLEIKHLESIFY